MIRGLVLQPIVTTRLKLKSQSHIVRCDIPDQVVAQFLLVSFAQHSRVELVVNLVRERAEEVKTRRSIELRLQQRPGLRQGRIRQCAVERNERNPAWRIERLWHKQRHKCAARHKLYPEVIL